MVIGEVVRLRERLRWWDGPGLHGRRVLVARAAEQSAETADAFVDLGAAVVEIPMIRVGDPSRPEELSVALRSMAAGRYDVVAFTSANGVRRTFAALRSLGLDARAFGRARSPRSAGNSPGARGLGDHRRRGGHRAPGSRGGRRPRLAPRHRARRVHGAPAPRGGGLAGALGDAPGARRSGR
ncbi:MAG: uroporphyrinogen-III synthase [Deltaproteobacteria bacterium]|nr:uroporphyrinogen-III synthase [Deltaproteobacteria bacterium]